MPATSRAIPLHVNLLGEFSLACGGRPVTSVDTERLRALLAYLALHRNAAPSRRHIAFSFWPSQ